MANKFRCIISCCLSVSFFTVNLNLYRWGEKSKTPFNFLLCRSAIYIGLSVCLCGWPLMEILQYFLPPKPFEWRPLFSISKSLIFSLFSSLRQFSVARIHRLYGHARHSETIQVSHIILVYISSSHEQQHMEVKLSCQFSSIFLLQPFGRICAWKIIMR